MKKLFSAVIVSAFAAGVFAQAAKKEVKCPIMQDHKVNVAKATKEKMFADYKGRRYFFCCAGCPGAFKSNPAKYAKNAESIKIPKKAAKKAK